MRLLLTGLVSRLAALALVCSAVAALAQERPLDAAQAEQWLTRMHNAARTANYQGTFVVSRGGQMISSRVAHFCDGTQTYERIDMLDGQSRQVLRHNDKVLTVWPTQRTATLEERWAAPQTMGSRGIDPRLLAHYDVLAEGRHRVAGHETTMLLLRPRDDLRFARRLWVEQTNGLILRTDVLSSDGRVLESSAFSEVALAVKPQPRQITQSMKRLEGLQVVKSPSSRTALEAQGWRVKALPPGFVPVGCVQRTWRAESAAAGKADHPVVQAIFSDGLTHVSLFLEPHRADHNRPSGVVATGATHTLMTRVAGHELTVIGDVPPATLSEFANALERLR
jgi:sigma-E factor negative regulatory protein RseB